MVVEGKFVLTKDLLKESWEFPLPFLVEADFCYRNLMILASLGTNRMNCARFPLDPHLYGLPYPTMLKATMHKGGGTSTKEQRL